MSRRPSALTVAATSATHTFVSNGWAKAILSFTGSDGQPTTATGNFGIGNGPGAP
ncbi:MAG: hypothetical protein HY700_19590 [Gemmatimonadetes bacterium]|nr:hypothetical protein [Gemmatimonadota bacterium]